MGPSSNLGIITSREPKLRRFPKIFYIGILVAASSLLPSKIVNADMQDPHYDILNINNTSINTTGEF
jgi:hypothetical protein